MVIRVRHAVTRPQQAFLSDPSPFRAFIGGIGSGKTRAGVLALLRMPAGSRGMVVAATYRILKDATLRSVLDVCKPFITYFNKQDMRIVLANGTEVLFRSADNPEHLRGPNIGFFWIDEAALVNEEVWDILIGRLREPPMRAWVTTTPKGFNWLYRVFVQDASPEYSLHRARTEDNIFLPPDYVRRLRLKYSSAFARQELDAEFVSMEGARVPREWVRYGEPVSIARTAVGVDLAISQREGADFTAAVVVTRDQDGRLFVRYARRARLTFHNILRFISDIAQRFHPDVIHIEANQFQAAVVQELLRTTSLPVVPVQASKDKLLRFQIAEARYEQGLIYHSPSLPPEFEDEVSSFPNSDHDDFCDALVYAIGGAISTLPDLAEVLADAGYHHVVL